jgi:hypothetical protein
MIKDVELAVDKFPRRCPYCGEILPDPNLPDQETGELREMCPFCKKVFVRIHISWDEFMGPEV